MKNCCVNEIHSCCWLRGIILQERIYAHWFCDGNFTDARAHMLPKKGDVLQMDWSQLR